MVIIKDNWSYVPQITTNTSTEPCIYIKVPILVVAPAYQETYIQPRYDPCANCSNNPKNNPYASGNCCCSLPDMYKIT